MNYSEEDLRRMGYTIQDGRAFRMKGVMPPATDDKDHRPVGTFPVERGVTHPPETRRKYHNKPCYVDNIRFDSQREAEFYIALSIRQKAGDIRELKRQVPFDLCCPITLGYNQDTPASIVVATYVADFTYLDDHLHVCDAKSEPVRKNQVYQLKRRWMNLQYGIFIEEL